MVDIELEISLLQMKLLEAEGKATGRTLLAVYYKGQADILKEVMDVLERIKEDGVD